MQSSYVPLHGRQLFVEQLGRLVHPHVERGDVGRILVDVGIDVDRHDVRQDVAVVLEGVQGVVQVGFDEQRVGLFFVSEAQFESFLLPAQG